MVPETEIGTLVEMGFVVIIPEYRLCPQVSVYDGPIRDAEDCLQWARQALPGLLSSEGVNVDSDRVASMGHSAGGGLAMHLVSNLIGYLVPKTI